MKITVPIPAVPKTQVSLFLFVLFSILLGFFIFSSLSNKEYIARVYAQDFEYLSKNGNSSCSAGFKNSIGQMADEARLQGSCCSPMNLHRYTEQREGLKKYKSIKEIPPDPYNIEAGLAKKLMAYYDMQLTPNEQQVYDFAMQNSKEKGPCCCKCWRWFVYGGLGKYLIRERNFTGKQVVEVWDLSDGCGGQDNHVNHAN